MFYRFLFFGDYIIFFFFFFEWSDQSICQYYYFVKQLMHSVHKEINKGNVYYPDMNYGYPNFNIITPLVLNDTHWEKLCFIITLKKAVSQRFYFKVNRKSIGSSKSCTSDFQNLPAFERSACIYVTISEIFERFQYFNTLSNTFFGAPRHFIFGLLQQGKKVQVTSKRNIKSEG